MGNTLRNIAKDDSGKPIITTYKGRTIWVSFETHKGKTKYRLADPAKKPKPFRGSLRAKKALAIKEFYEYIQDKKNIDYVVYKSLMDRTNLNNPYSFSKEYTDFIKLSKEEVEKLKTDASEEDLEKIAKMEALTDSIERVKDFDATMLKEIKKATGEEAITTPLIKIEPLFEDDELFEKHKIDKNYIIEEFMKMLADNPAEIAALTTIPQFVDLPVPKK